MSTNDSQLTAFAQGEGDQWFARNCKALTTFLAQDEKGPVYQTLATIDFRPKRVLEIGCSNGTKLDVLRRHLYPGADFFGIDPSSEAICDGKARFPGLNLSVGMADSLDFSDGYFDLVIYGFCLCYCDRSSLFKVIHEGNRVLADQGLLTILDFHTPMPYRNPYCHREGMFCYKMDYSRVFTWHPYYFILRQHVFCFETAAPPMSVDSRHAVTVLAKDSSLPNAEPFR
jgi:SAM-dependent methyltransferase